jgi:hypothetical protein
MMKRLLALLLLVLLLILLAGCEEEGRTRIVLKGFDNSTGTETVYVTVAAQYFVPGYPVTSDYTIAEAAPGTVADLVLLDITASDTLDEYFLYILEDSDASGGASAGDAMLPVITLRPEAGETVELYGLVNDTGYTYQLNPDNRTFLNFNNLFPADPSPARPLLFLSNFGAGPADYTVITPSLSLTLTDPAAVSRLSFFFTATGDYTFLCILDMDNSGTLTAGDYVSATDPTSVFDSFWVSAGDSEYTFSLYGYPY